MKYIVVLGDGMADEPIEALGNKTPLAYARTPVMDRLSKMSEIGMVHTIPDGMKPGSDTANLAVLGYDPKIYYSGRSPLEALSIGVPMKATDIALRCNIVTLSEEDVPFEEKKILDHSSGEISTEDCTALLDAVRKELETEEYRFYAGTSYRHCLIWNNGTTDLGKMTPPHDITGKVITEHLSDSENAKPLIEMMKKSYNLLKDHPINLERKARGKRPANSIWLWGEGTRPAFDSFQNIYGLKGGVVSAVDLIKGLGGCAGMAVADVEGATGYIDTNFEGKAHAGLKLLEDGCDMVYIHFEAPDECGHRNEPENKVRAIEMIDERVLPILFDGLNKYDDYKIMILPDHPTPIVTRTHASDPVPYLIYQKSTEQSTDSGVDSINEESAKATGRYIDFGPGIMSKFLGE